MNKRIFIWIFLFTALFFPLKVRIKAKAEKAVVSAAECVMERKSRRILYEWRGDMRLPMASTTKIATAITALEECPNVKEIFEISSEAVGIEGSSIYLKVGETYSTEDLLYGLMLRSGNDAAEALAYRFGGNIDGFALKMNQTAQKVGALHTNFRNPHGLPCDGHYTTARDLSLITAYALENSTFREIVGTKYYEARHWKNKNKMLFQYDGAIGVKTGYTKEAGRCLVSAATKDGMELVCTVLNSPQMYERSTQLLDDAFKAFSYEKIVDKKEIFTVDGQACCLRENVYYPLMQGEIDAIEILITPIKHSKKAEIIGQIEISLAKRLIFSGNLYKL